MSSSLKDVATRAGLSPAAVSRHLNGTLDLPEETRGRIDRAVRELGYRPNALARRLSLGQSDTIALILPDIANPFFSSLAAAVEHAASAHSKMVQLQATSGRREREIAALRLARDNRADGVVFCTNRLASVDVTRAIADLPRVVIVDEAVPGARTPQLFADNMRGGELAGRHLAAHGHRRVAYIGGDPHLGTTRARSDGLRRGLSAGSGGEEVHVTLYSGSYDVASGRANAAHLLEAGCGSTAIFTGSDELTIGVIETLRAHGRRIPQDFSLISFDGARALHLYDPPITAIRQPSGALGARAVDLLLADGWEDGDLPDLVEYLPVDLIERGSVARMAQRQKT